MPICVEKNPLFKSSTVDCVVSCLFSSGRDLFDWFLLFYVEG